MKHFDLRPILRDEVFEAAAEVLKEMGHEMCISKDEIKITMPKDLEHGDFSTNAPIIIGNKLGVDTNIIAEKISEKIKQGIGKKDDEIKAIKWLIKDLTAFIDKEKEKLILT